MQQTPDDNSKRRLTEPDQLAVVADFMLARGFPLDEIPVRLSRYYYVDIDLLNDILFRGAMPAAAQPPVEQRWQDVA